MKTSTVNLALCAALLAGGLTSPLPALAAEAEVLKRLDAMAAEIEQLRAELAATKKSAEALTQRQQVQNQATAPAVLATIPGNAAASLVNTMAVDDGALGRASGFALGPQTVISSYGEIGYTRPKNNSSGAQTDVGRAVIGITHRFDDKTKMVAEFEWEHAVTSASDKGESEVEQLYVEREFNTGLRAKGGLYLMPVGLLNTNHEPTVYYGVFRNFVETAIIPTTWREAGFGLSSTMDNGLTWDTGLTTGFDLSKWDSTSADGRSSPLRSIHQEGQLAKSGDLSVHGALNWRGLPGLLLGGSVFTGKGGQKTPGFAAPNARVSLMDLHGRYTPGKWDLSALYARGTISNTEALNLTFVGNPTPVPSTFFGWYAQAAYQLWRSSDYRLAPFVRLERFNTASAYSTVPAGLATPTGPTEQVVTAGASFYFGEGVVVKADYQKFKSDTSRDRFNLGVGYSF